MISLRSDLEKLWSTISIKNPKQECLSLLSRLSVDELVVLEDGAFWLRLLSMATSQNFRHQSVKEMDTGEIGQLYFLFGVKGDPVETVLSQVRETYLELRDSDLLGLVDIERVSDCFFVLLSLYPLRKCDSQCQQSLCLFHYGTGLVGRECNELYEAVGNHYGVSFLS